MRIFARLISIFAITLFTLTPIASAEWSEAQSENFIFVGEVSERRARNAVKGLEIFRSSVFRIFGWTYGPEPIPIRVYGARSRRDINQIIGRRGIAGAYKTDHEGPTFILNMSSGRTSNDVKSVAYHEFVHHLTNTYGYRRFPTWYNEGYAEYLSTFTVKKYSTTSTTRVIIGEPHEGRARTILNERRYNWDDFFSAVRGYPFKFEDRRAQTGAFYAQGWLAAHYIQSTPGHPEKMEAYLNLLHTVDAPEDAFELSFGLTPSEYGIILEKYFKRNRYPAKVIEFDETFHIPEITTRRLNKSEAAFYEAEAIRTFNRAEGEDLEASQAAAEKLYKKSIDTGGSPAQADSSRALMALKTKDYSDAIAAAEAAIELAPTDSRALHIASLIYYHRYVGDSPDKLDTDLQAAQSYSLRSMQANPDNIGAHFIHALSYAGPARTPSTQAISSAIDSSSYFRSANYDYQNLLLANLLIKGDKPEEAKRILEDINQWSQSQRSRTRAQRMLEYLSALN